MSTKYWAIAGLLALGTIPGLAQSTQPTAPTAPPPAPAPATAPASTPGTIIADSAENADDIRDIRGAISIERKVDWYVVALAVSGTIMVLALIAAAILYYKLKKKVLLPHERALISLGKAREEASEGDGKKYAYAVSEIVRGYIEERFNVRATHETTEEFLRELAVRPNGALIGYTESLQNFLTGTDIVKFAGVQVSEKEIDEFHQTASSFVVSTAPQSEDPKTSKSAPPINKTGAVQPPPITEQASDESIDLSTKAAAQPPPIETTPAQESEQSDNRYLPKD